jgi:hypothetical protein
LIHITNEARRYHVNLGLWVTDGFDDGAELKPEDSPAEVLQILEATGIARDHLILCVG